jgi:hypothetical protein
VEAVLFELNLGASDQFSHGAGNEQFRRSRQRHHPSTDVHGDPSQLPLHNLALACVKAGANVNAKRLHRSRDRGRAAERERRFVKYRSKAVAGRVLFPPTSTLQFSPDDAPETRKQLAEAAVAKLRGERGRTDDIDEQNRRETPIAQMAHHPSICRPDPRWKFRSASRDRGRPLAVFL